MGFTVGVSIEQWRSQQSGIESFTPAQLRAAFEGTGLSPRAADIQKLFNCRPVVTRKEFQVRCSPMPAIDRCCCTETGFLETADPTGALLRVARPNAPRPIQGAETAALTHCLPHCLPLTHCLPCMVYCHATGTQLLPAGVCR